MARHRSTKARITHTGPSVIILGPQGAGKGTQAELLARRHHVAHLETGAMLRAIAAKPTSAFGRHVAGYIDRGKLVPFTWVLKLLDQRLTAIPLSQGIVIDGSPRRFLEALSLLRMLRKHHRTVGRVFFVTVQKKETIKRLSRRWICVTCARSLIMGKDVRKSTDVCPYCKGPIKRRADETPVAIARRLAIYEKDTRPVIAHFRKQKLLVRINGKQTIENVYRDINKYFPHDRHEVHKRAR